MASGKKRVSPVDTTDDVLPNRLDVRETWFVISAATGLTTAPFPPKRRIVIGRGTSSDIVVEDGSVSREHAAIFDLGGELCVEDLGSRNKTKVMGRALAPGESVPVAVGSVIEIGYATIVLQRGRPPSLASEAPSREREPAALSEVVLVDPTMQRLYAMLEVIAPSPLNVLLLGETGTGKEVFAEVVHRGSLRAAAPFLRVNCAGLSGSLLESELFGHEKGAFTGAVAAKPGLFEAAHGGTLFLDEIGEMPIDTQAKVLRVIESGDVIRVGSVVPRRVDVRYVAATHRDLQTAIAENRFRADLYFRLNGYTMTLPPLRERRKDILPLVEWFLERMAKPGHPMAPLGPAPSLATEARTLLERHAWPGNVRELKNVIERARVLAGAGRAIEAAHLQLGHDADGAHARATSSGPVPAPLRSRRHSFEDEHILSVLERTKGDRKAAAEILGLSYRTLLAKLSALGLGRRSPKSGEE